MAGGAEITAQRLPGRGTMMLMKKRLFAALGFGTLLFCLVVPVTSNAEVMPFEMVRTAGG